jgi:hypothetical protein
MLSKVLVGVILVLFVVIIVLFVRGRKTEKLEGCPVGCVSTNPDPCPFGYKIHPTTLMCAPASTIPPREA